MNTTNKENKMQKISFIGRKSGAIGITYLINALVPKDCSAKEAMFYLSDRYEHISGIKFLETSQDQFNQNKG